MTPGRELTPRRSACVADLLVFDAFVPAGPAAAVGELPPDLLFCSFGADTYAGDPISHFAIETGDYPVLAGRIASLGMPTLIVMEGGYAVDALGANVEAFLSGF